MPTQEQLAEIFPEAEDGDLAAYTDALNEAMDEFGIDTPERQAMFLAQCAHESGQFRHVSENLNYSADGLRKTFPSHFSAADAPRYARHPERIANRAYANRMDNGNEASGDGWKYRGRGLIQLTGHNNYEACGQGLNVDLMANPEYLETPQGAARSAAWFWDENELNKYADTLDIAGCTKAINGGTIGLPERTKLWNAACRELGA